MWAKGEPPVLGTGHQVSSILTTRTRGENSLSQDERTAHIFSRSTNWQGGTHKSELQRGYELFKLIQLGGVNHLNAEMAEWQTHLTQNQASIPHVGSSPTFGTKDSYSNYINYKFMSSVQVRFYAISV